MNAAETLTAIFPGRVFVIDENTDFSKLPKLEPVKSELFLAMHNNLPEHYDEDHDERIESRDYVYEVTMQHPEEGDFHVEICADGLYDYFDIDGPHEGIGVTLSTVPKGPGPGCSLQVLDVCQYDVIVHDDDSDSSTRDIAVTGNAAAVVREFLRCYGACYISIEIL